MSAETKIGYTPGGDINRGVTTLTITDTTVQNVYVSLDGARRWSAQSVSTGTVTATIKVYASNSYIPHPRLGASSPIRAGTWTEVTTECDGIVNPAGSASNGLIRPKTTSRFADAGFLKIEVTPASGTGTLTLYNRVTS